MNCPRAVIAAAAATMLLGGCANLMSIHHTFTPDSGSSISIDAKQRAIYSIEKIYLDPDDPERKKVKYRWRAICAEPSPDAIAAISASAGLSAEAMQKALSAAFSSQEAAASIGLRTQTIQILRDAMYRLCEGYASGALDDIGFTRLQRRYQNIMLGLLAIEQLTGAVVAKQAVLSGSAEASVARTLAELQKLLSQAKAVTEEAQSAAAKAKAARDEADAALKKAEAEYQKIKKDNGDNEDAEPVKKFKVEILVPAQKKANAAKTEHDAAQRVANNAVEEERALEALRNDLGKVATRSMTRGELAGGGYHSAVNALTAQTIATAVKDIVEKIAGRDYGRETCMDAVLSRELKSLEPAQFKLAAQYCGVMLQVEVLQLTDKLKGLGGAEAAAADKERALASKGIGMLFEIIDKLPVTPNKP